MNPKGHALARHVRKEMLIVFTLAALALIIAALFVHPRSAFVSAEVQFTDASKSGLAIVPASCPSAPDYYSSMHSYDKYGEDVGPVLGSCDYGAAPAIARDDQASYQQNQCALTASSYTINQGDSVTLEWNTTPYSPYTNAGSVYPVRFNIDNGVGAVSGPDGSVTVSPTQTTHYTLTEQVWQFAFGQWYYFGTGYDDHCDATITVNPPLTSSCPDGSAAPNGAPAQCTCAQGNVSQCSGLCPDGSAALNGDSSQCTCAQGNAAQCSGGCPSGYALQGGTCVYTGCSTGYTFQNSQCVFTGCPSGYTQQGNSCVFSNCPTGYTQEGAACVFSGCPVGYTQQGNSCVFSSCPVGYTQQGNSCVFAGCPSGYTLQSGQCLLLTPSAPLGDIAAAPSILKSGSTSQISWTAQNVSSCSVSGTNGDSWSCSGASCNATTTETSSAINAETTYTLSCAGLDNSTFTSSATVNIIPKFNEQ